VELTDEILDAGKRASDTINLHRAFMNWDELKHKWIAFRLSDGGTDGTLYDSKKDAVSHQLNEFQCFYVAFRSLAGGSTPREMTKFLQFCRDAYDAGFRLPDPDSQSGGPDVLMTAGQHDYYRKAFNDAYAQRLRNKLGV